MSVLSIRILTFNNHEMTDACLASVLRQKIPFPHDIAIVDNGSEYPYKSEKFRVIRLFPNRGIASGINECFKSAVHDWVLFVSNDVRWLGENSIWNLFKAGHTDSVQAMPLVYLDNGLIDCAGMDYRWPGYGIGRRKYKGVKTEIIPNITFLCNKSLWAGAGKFDERMQGIGYEDVDFGLRLKGLKIVVQTSAALHLGNQTFKKTESHHRESYHRNRLYTVKKNYTGWRRLARETALRVMDTVRARLP